MYGQGRLVVSRSVDSEPAWWAETLSDAARAERAAAAAAAAASVESACEGCGRECVETELKGCGHGWCDACLLSGLSEAVRGRLEGDEAAFGVCPACETALSEFEMRLLLRNASLVSTLASSASQPSLAAPSLTTPASTSASTTWTPSEAPSTSIAEDEVEPAESDYADSRLRLHSLIVRSVEELVKGGVVEASASVYLAASLENLTVSVPLRSVPSVYCDVGLEQNLIAC